MIVYMCDFVVGEKGKALLTWDTIIMENPCDLFIY